MSANSSSQMADSKAGKAWLAHECGFCGAKGGQYLRHYEVMRCSCGHFFWALQPKWNGPLVLFVHPGFHPKEAE